MSKAKASRKYEYNVEYVIRKPNGKLERSFRNIRSAAKWFISCEAFEKKRGYTFTMVTLDPKSERQFSITEATLIVKGGTK